MCLQQTNGTVIIMNIYIFLTGKTEEKLQERKNTRTCPGNNTHIYKSRSDEQSQVSPVKTQTTPRNMYSDISIITIWFY